MKKLISVLLVLLMLVTLCATVACSKKEEPATTPAAPTDPAAPGGAAQADPGTDTDVAQEAQDAVNSGEVTAEMMDNSKPNEYVFEKIAAGREVHIGISFLNIGDEFQKMYTDGLKADFESLGFTSTIANANGDSVLQLEQIENYVTMKSAGIVIRVGDVDVYQSVYEQCVEQGTYMAMFAAIPTEWQPDMVAPVDQVEQGTQVCNMLFAWMDLRYPDAEAGSIHAAVFGRTDNTENVTRYETMKSVIVTDPRIDLTFIQDSALTLEEGYNAAQAALSFDPEIRVFLANSGTALVGANNYVFSQPQYDPSEFACFGTGADATALRMVEESKTDISIFRGIIATGYDVVWGAIFRGMIALFEGKAEAPYTYWERQYAVASFDYYYDSDDSAA